jgi:hypothetical protein
VIPGLTAHNVFKGDLVVLGHDQSPNLTVYRWDNGFGARITTPTGIFPVNGDVYDIAFRSDKKRFYTANRATNNYDTFRTRRFANGVLDIGSSTMTTPGFADACDLRPQNDWYGWAHNNTPGVSFKPADIDGFGAGARAAMTSYNGGSDVKFSSTGDDVVMSIDPTPYVFAGPFTSSGPGTKYTDMASIPNPTDVFNVAWSATDSQVALGSGNNSLTNTIQAYRFTPGTGWGTKFTAPVLANRPTGICSGIVFRKDNDVLVINNGTASAAIIAYAWSTAGFGTKFANPATLPAVGSDSNSRGKSRFTKDGNNLIVGALTTPFVHAWAWSAGFGTKYSDPSNLPPDRVNVVKVV